MDDQLDAESRARLGMLIDLRKCYGCHSCTVACSQEHGLRAGVSRNKVVTVGPTGQFPDLSMHYVPQVCVQCEKPACRDVCPTGAIAKSEATGIVTVQEAMCTGCALCTLACPYGAIDFDARKGGGFATRTGKVEIFSNTFASLGADPLPFFQEPAEESPCNLSLAADYPLIATNRRSPYFFHTEFRQVPWLRELEPEPIVEIHPDTARSAGIAENDWVYIETKLGRAKQRARLTGGVHPRIICSRHGWWFPERPVGDNLHGAWESNLNMVTRNDRGQGFDPLIGCPQLRGFLCRISKA